MNVKDNGRNFQLVGSKKRHIKYIITLLLSSSLFILFFLSILNLLSGKQIFLGNTVIDILMNSVFLFLGTIAFILAILLGFYVSIKNLQKTEKIIFDKFNKEAVFITQNRLFGRDFFKKIPFSEISGIEVEQEQESDYIILSILHENKEISVDSDYGPEGMERLNNLAESIQKFVGAPLQKGQFEDIYIEEEEEDTKKDNIDKNKKPDKGHSGK